MEHRIPFVTSRSRLRKLQLVQINRLKQAAVCFRNLSPGPTPHRYDIRECSVYNCPRMAKSSGAYRLWVLAFLVSCRTIPALRAARAAHPEVLIVTVAAAGSAETICEPLLPVMCARPAHLAPSSNSDFMHVSRLRFRVAL
jgi:hypothetical protein